jgi:hypothetical protein
LFKFIYLMPPASALPALALPALALPALALPASALALAIAIALLDPPALALLDPTASFFATFWLWSKV